MKRYSILGISLRDYTAREALKQIDRFLNGGAMNTVACVTVQNLTETAKQDAVKELIENTDMTLCAEAEILEAAGIASMGRIHEIREQTVLRECLRKTAKRGGSVFFLGDTQKEAQTLEEAMLKLCGDIRVAGCAGYDFFDRRPEQLMNALNEAAPQIIFSRMSWPQDLELMHQCSRFLNAMLWIAMPEKDFYHPAKAFVAEKIRNMIFRKKVNKYNSGKTD